jgi:hypothetical protein
MRPGVETNVKLPGQARGILLQDSPDYFATFTPSFASCATVVFS